jgi:hypothetical protein
MMPTIRSASESGSMILRGYQAGSVNNVCYSERATICYDCEGISPVVVKRPQHEVVSKFSSGQISHDECIERLVLRCDRPYGRHCRIAARKMTEKLVGSDWVPIVVRRAEKVLDKS